VRTSQGWPKPPASALFEGWTFRTLPPSVQLSDEIEKLRGEGFMVSMIGQLTAP
jgi:hypothetical protein